MGARCFCQFIAFNEVRLVLVSNVTSEVSNGTSEYYDEHICMKLSLMSLSQLLANTL